MLRFHRFTIGHAWCSDYGNADNSREEFENLLAYSPLHNVRAPKVSTQGHAVRSIADSWCVAHRVMGRCLPQLGEPQLPALLVTTGDHDDRVVPLHSLKTVATLQEVAGRSPVQRNPLVIRIGTKAGHGAGKPTSMVLQEYSEMYAFMAKYTGAVWTYTA